MRFETRVLTRDPGSDVYCGYRRRLDDPWGGTACQTGIQRKPHCWDLTDARQIVLVFSTVPVRGAATCKVSALNHAGRVARLSHPQAYHLTGRTPLWWWPEVVW